MPRQPDPKKDEPVHIPLDPEDVLRALLKVDPDSEPDDQDDTTGRHDDGSPSG